MHTGNVIHNHYHLPPAPTTPPPPQQIIVQQAAPQQPYYGQQVIPVQYYQKTNGGSWIFYGILSILFSFFEGINFLCCGVSFIGILSLLPHRDLKRRVPSHPEAGSIGIALLLNIIAVCCFLLYATTL